MISLVVISKNSQKTILRCIESANKICDEIIIVLDASNSDETESLLKSKNISIYTNKFSNFSDQKNFGISKAKNNWILSLDADEYLSNESINEISSINFSEDYSAYSLPRQNIFFNQSINHTNWGKEDDRKVRLFNKHHCMWKGVVHEQLEVRGKIKKLTHPIMHEPYNNVEDFIIKMNLYTSSESQFTFPFVDFIRRFILHKGYKDGVIGFFMSYLMVIYHTTTWVKLWLKKK